MFYDNQANMEYDIFISYSHKDLKIAKGIYKALADAGFSCFFDDTSIENPDFWPILAQGILKSKIFLYLGSTNTAKAKITPKELGFAIEYKEAKFIYPYFIEDCEIPVVHKLMLSDINQRYMNKYPVDSGLIPDLKRLLEIDPQPRVLLKEQIVRVDVEALHLEMIRVEGGSLELGATQEQAPYSESNEHPSYWATLPTYYISKYPITQDVWGCVMGYNKSHFNHKRSAGSEKHPAEQLTHDEAVEFVRRLSQKTNLSFSLPTEEEWEYAARGGQHSQHYIFAGSNKVDEVAWYKGNANGSTHPVGMKKPNELGLYDMCGNVWEWTKTPAHSYAFNVDPGGDVFIRRGGSWAHEALNCRVSKRYPSDRSKKTSGLGLRVVIRDNVEQ